MLSGGQWNTHRVAEVGDRGIMIVQAFLAWSTIWSHIVLIAISCT